MKRAVFAACALFLSLAACSTRDTEAAAPTDIAALGIMNMKVVENDLASSGQPSEEQFAQLPAADFHTVICLRSADESGTGWEEAKAKELGIDFVRIPVAGAAEIDELHARALDEALAAAADGGTLVCCRSGNRVGGLLAMRAYHVQGVTPAEALAYGKRGGLTDAEPVAREKLGLPKQD